MIVGPQPPIRSLWKCFGRCYSWGRCDWRGARRVGKIKICSYIKITLGTGEGSTSCHYPATVPSPCAKHNTSKATLVFKLILIEIFRLRLFFAYQINLLCTILSSTYYDVYYFSYQKYIMWIEFLGFYNLQSDEVVVAKITVVKSKGEVNEVASKSFD